MICGISCLLVTHFSSDTLGEIFGGIGLSKIKKTQKKYKWKDMAISSLVTRIIGIVVKAIILFFLPSDYFDQGQSAYLSEVFFWFRMLQIWNHESNHSPNPFWIF